MVPMNRTLEFIDYILWKDLFVLSLGRLVQAAVLMKPGGRSLFLFVNW